MDAGIKPQQFHQPTLTLLDAYDTIRSRKSKFTGTENGKVEGIIDVYAI